MIWSDPYYSCFSIVCYFNDKNKLVFATGVVDGVYLDTFSVCFLQSLFGIFNAVVNSVNCFSGFYHNESRKNCFELADMLVGILFNYFHN